MPTREISSSTAPSLGSAPESTLWQRPLRRAERQAERGQLQLAISSLEQAIAAGADASACYLRMAKLFRALHQSPAALDAAEKARELAPQSVSAHEMVMNLALETGDCERAITASRALLKISPKHLPAHDALGAAYIQMGDVDAAMRVINTLIRLSPENAAHHFKKALLCQHKGEIPLAVQEFSEAIVLEPEGPHADNAREALDILDTFQLNQIFTLSMDDAVFRIKLLRDPAEAATERGFYLSETGYQMLSEISQYTLPELPAPCHTVSYN